MEPTHTDNKGALSRRDWLATAVIGAVGIGLSADAVAQSAGVESSLKSMASITGRSLTEPWTAPTAALVGVIVESSKGLRQLDLHDIEPATIFRP
jgi:hypothetical protein